MIKQPGEQDWYRFEANQGEMWVVETDTRGLNSKLDSIIEIRGDDQSPLTQVRLQAVRDSYFTFRGKDSRQSDDFRVFAWEEMNLNDYFYASGEVTRYGWHRAVRIQAFCLSRTRQSLDLLRYFGVTHALANQLTSCVRLRKANMRR